MQLQLKYEGIIHNDEPTQNDRLNRRQYAEAFARLSETCETPLVIGLYGGWGIGKTSLMKLIDENLDKQKTHTVWFDPWQHQFDKNPTLALLHTVVDTLDMKEKEEGKKLLMVIAATLGSIILEATTKLKVTDVFKLGKHFEEERFQIREARVRLNEQFKKLIEKAQGRARKRIIFFIDDLDRCMPTNILTLLESLKLYLNLPGCVYFIGVDRQALEQSIKYYYKDIELSENSYLDKIVQLPFTIPPIPPESMEEFVDPLLSQELKQCSKLLVKGLGDNPRQVKRFVNTLMLNHQLASNLSISSYNPMVLALLLLIQYRNQGLYRLIERQPNQLSNLKSKSEETKILREEYLAKDERLKEVLTLTDIPEEKFLKQYIYLTQVARVAEFKEMTKEKNIIISIIASPKEKEYIKNMIDKIKIKTLFTIDEFFPSKKTMGLYDAYIAVIGKTLIDAVKFVDDEYIHAFYERLPSYFLISKEAIEIVKQSKALEKMFLLKKEEDPKTIIVYENDLDLMVSLQDVLYLINYAVLGK
jgi:hypothetical protein